MLRQLQAPFTAFLKELLTHNYLSKKEKFILTVTVLVATSSLIILVFSECLSLIVSTARIMLPSPTRWNSEEENYPNLWVCACYMCIPETKLSQQNPQLPGKLFKENWRDAPCFKTCKCYLQIIVKNCKNLKNYARHKPAHLPNFFQCLLGQVRHQEKVWVLCTTCFPDTSYYITAKSAQ